MRLHYAAMLCVPSALVAAGCAAAQPPQVAGPVAAPVASPAQSAEQTTIAFLEVFKALDAERFDAFFAPDATMFFPEGPFPKERVVGKEAVTAAFHRFFDMAKQRGLTRLGFEPVKILVQQYPDFAVATFQLEGNDKVGRRSIVLRRDGEQWRIVHFHASAVEVSE